MKTTYLSIFPKPARASRRAAEQSPPYTDDEIIARALQILATRLSKKGAALDSPETVKKFLTLTLAEESREVFVVLLLDKQHCVLDAVSLFYGTIDGASVWPREILKLALDKNAAAVIVAHNHPSGVPEPSDADKWMTEHVKAALRLVDIKLLDHCVVGGSRVVSMAERGLV